MLVFEILYLLLLIAVIIKIIYDTPSPVKALAYITLAIVLPFIGMFIYFSIGINYRKQKLYKRKLIQSEPLFQLIKRYLQKQTVELLKKNQDLIGNFEDSVQMLWNDSMSPLLRSRNTHLLINGEQKFKEVLKALEKAKRYILIEYYIFSDDVIGNQIKDVLIKKAKEGVEIRFIFDDFGSHSLHKKMLSELKANGIQAAPFYKIRLYALANRLNYRNHRKIIIIDGNIGFVGGINVDDRYINTPKKKQRFWRDTHLMFEGDAVKSLQHTFINDWNFCSENPIEVSEEAFYKEELQQMKAGEEDAFVQIATSGPDSSRASIMLSFLGIIMECKQRLFITTPYFIPNETILDALKHAALGGVDVRLLVPGISDSKLVSFASRTHYSSLLEAGVKIYCYQKGFVHTKALVGDDTLSVIGSANIDIRSFDLNFEVNALIFSKNINQQLAKNFLRDIKDSTLLNLQEWEKRTYSQKFIEACARLLSPLL